MRIPLLCAVLIAGLCGAASAQAPASAPSAAAPRLAGPSDLAAALDPYDPAAERTRFLRAAGIDNEIDANEFEADRSRTDPFVRKFDHWEELLKYDKDKNGRIDWFEADAYRQALHEALLAAFDENKDGVLRGAERDAANQALAGENPFARIAGRAAQIAHDGAAGEAGVAGGEASSLVYTPPDYKTLLEKFDKDGDGQLNDEEKQAARQYTREERHKWELEHFDKDGDGKLSDEERKAMQAELERARQPREEIARSDSPAPQPSEEERKAAEARRQAVSPELLQKYDKDGDGKLSDEERKAMKDDLRAQWEARQKEMLRKYDADGDGKLNDEERKKMMEDLRGQGRGMGGRGSSGGGQ